LNVREKGYSFVFVMLCVLFSVALVVSNIIAGKLWQLPLGIVLTGGVILFPIVYIIGDVVPEVYGWDRAHKLINIGFVANVVAVLFFMLTLALTPPGFWKGQDAFVAVLGFTPRLLLASFIAYYCGTHVNAWIMTRMKKMTGPRYLWVRTITSTVFGEGVDSAIFITIAFFGTVPVLVLPGMILAQATFKTLYEALATPLTYLVINYIKQLEGVDQFASLVPADD
jgi:queuosine precursor transporter